MEFVQTRDAPVSPFEYATPTAHAHVASAVAVAAVLEYAAPAPLQTVAGRHEADTEPVADVALAEYDPGAHCVHVMSAAAVATAAKRVPAGHVVETAAHPAVVANWSAAHEGSVHTREAPVPPLDVAAAVHAHVPSAVAVAGVFA